MVVLAQLQTNIDALRVVPILSSPDDRTRFVLAAVNVRDAAERVVAASVRQARHDGASWQAVGDTLGVTRQAAFQRYGKPIDPRTGELMNTTPLAGAAALAVSVIDDFAAGRWEKVTARFDSTMQKGLTEEALAGAWAQITAQAGAFESHGDPEVARAADVTITNTPLGFEAGDFVARISIRDDQTIAGLYILPPELS